MRRQGQHTFERNRHRNGGKKCHEKKGRQICSLEFWTRQCFCHFRKCSNTFGCDSCLAVRRCGTVRDRPAAVNHAHVQGACWLRITWIAHGIPTHPASAAAILIKVSVVVLVKESVLQATFALNARRVDGFTVCRASGCYAYVTKSPLCVFSWERKKGFAVYVVH